MIYQTHETYGHNDDKIDVIFKCKDPDRLSRFSFYLTIGLALCQHDDLLLGFEHGGAPND